MTESIIILLAGVFLPLFPMSMVFNAVLENIKQPWLKVLVFTVWPLCGFAIVFYSGVETPQWVLMLALFTSALYALRMLSLREVNQWTGFLAISIWSLLWLAVAQDISEVLLYSYALSMTVPLVLLVMLSAGLEKRFGAAYTGLYGGLARTIPRFSGVLVTVIVASVATPLFPSFFIMFDMVVETIDVMPFASIILLLIWLLWSWASARLIQGLIVGRASNTKVADIGVPTIGFYSIVLVALAVTGIYMSRVIL